MRKIIIHEDIIDLKDMSRQCLLKKKKKGQPKNGVMFYSVDKSEDLSPGHRISDDSERLLFLLKDVVDLAAFLLKANTQSLYTRWLLLFSL